MILQKMSYLSCLLFILCGSIGRADYVVDFYEIDKNIPGLIQIRSGTFRGKENHEALKKDVKALAEKGIFLADGSIQNQVQDKTKLGKYEIVSKLTINKPRGSGLGGANWTANIEVLIDGKQKLILPLGYIAGDKTVKEITITYDGWIDVLAFNESGKMLSLPFKAKGFRDDKALAVLIDNSTLKPELK